MNPRPDASPRFLRWYAEDRPAWPAPITTMSVLSATRDVGGRVEVGRVGLGVLVSSEGFFALIVMCILQRWSVRLSRFAGKKESRRADSNRFPAPATSWLAAILERTTPYRYVA